jgi:anti-sigma B factor antagonist
MIEVELRGSTTCLTLAVPRLDAARVLAFKDDMRAVTASGMPGRVVLDMGRVEFLDSSGLGALVAAMKMLPPGRRLELASCGPAVSRVLKLTRMDRVFVLHPDREAALASGERAA